MWAVNFYHISAKQLSGGTVLESRFFEPHQLDQVSTWASLPWGRIDALKPAMAAPPVLREVIFERVRRSHFPALRSRLKSVYLCRSIEHAQALRRNLAAAGEDRPYLHACSCVPGIRLFEGDMAWVSGFYPHLNFGELIAVFAKNARRYWSGEKSETPVLEILAPSMVVRIEKPIEWAVIEGR